MKTNIDYYTIAKDKMQIVLGLEKEITHNNLIDKKLMELIKIRVSQMNGCAYCLEMHTKDARSIDVSEDQIYLLNVWHETDLYSDAQKVALKLAEIITTIHETTVTEAMYQEVRKFYSEEEYIDLVMIINQINMWNRLSVSMGSQYNSAK